MSWSILLSTLLLAVSLSSIVTATSPRLRHDVDVLCTQFRTVSAYVAANCSSPLDASVNTNCLESFESFAASPSLLIACEEREQDAAAKQSMVQFLQLYNAWQQHHLCDLFHTKEERAARRCGGAAVQTPWHEEAYPLYCEEIFELYKTNRETLDATCARTPFSDTFWEAYADYIASPLCKQYYKHVRDATSLGCASNDSACETMFQWYTHNRDHVERECIEVQGAKPFYKGFYAWKRRHS